MPRFEARNDLPDFLIGRENILDGPVQALRVAMRLGGEARATAETLARRTTSEAFGPLLEGQGLLPACPAPLQ